MDGMGWDGMGCETKRQTMLRTRCLRSNDLFTMRCDASVSFSFPLCCLCTRFLFVCVCCVLPLCCCEQSIRSSRSAIHVDWVTPLVFQL